MRFSFDEDQLAVRATVREVLERECTAPVVRAAWEPGADPRLARLWRTLAEVGAVGLTAPERAGGLGAGWLELCGVLEECGRAALPAPLAETTAVAIPLLCRAGDDALIDRWVGPAAAGAAVLTVGLGGAPLVAWADRAELLLLEDDGALFAVPRADVRLTAQPSVDGARRLFAVAWSPRADHRVLAGDAARAALAAAADDGALAAATELCGIAARLIDVTVEYALVRHQFGKPIGSFQAVKHQLADARLRLELARPVVYRAAHSAARGAADRSLHVSMAKAYASEAAGLAGRTALQVHGAIGYSFEHDLHLWMKRGWALAAAWGDAAWHRRRVADAVLGPAPAPAPPR